VERPRRTHCRRGHPSLQRLPRLAGQLAALRPFQTTFDLTCTADDTALKAEWTYTPEAISNAAASPDQAIDFNKVRAHIREALISTFGLDLTRIPTTGPLAPNTFAAIEVHIEQGPLLERAMHTANALQKASPNCELPIPQGFSLGSHKRIKEEGALAPAEPTILGIVTNIAAPALGTRVLALTLAKLASE
jgi:hypothetical protein